MTDTSRFADLIADFEKDVSKENDGVWMTFKRFRYRVARAHRDNIQFLKMMTEKMSPYQWAIDRGNMDAVKEVAGDLLKVVYATTVLLEVQKIDGTKIETNAEDRVALFNRLPDLWDEIVKYSGTGSNYGPDLVEQDSGN